MKKSITLLLVLALILGIFAKLAAYEIEDPEQQSSLAVAVVAASAFGDMAFNDSAREGVEQLKADLGISTQYYECNYSNIKQTLMDAADSADVVVAVGWQCYEISEVAPEHPDVKFILVDNPAEGIQSIPNLLSITYAQNEGSFLAGYIAASMSKTGIISAAGAEDTPTVNDYIAGYRQGARHANPDIEIKKVYAADFDAEDAGSRCVQKLAADGADIIYNIAGSTGSSIFEAARENSLYVIGTEADQKLAYPQFDGTILCSMKKNIGQSLYDVIWAYSEDGTWEGAKVMLSDMASGHISIAYGNEESLQQISDELKAEVEELAGQIISGDIKVKTTRE